MTQTAMNITYYVVSTKGEETVRYLTQVDEDWGFGRSLANAKKFRDYKEAISYRKMVLYKYEHQTNKYEPQMKILKISYPVMVEEIK